MIKLYTVLDKQSKVTNHPFPMQTDRDAIEGFKQVVNDEKTTISKYPDDFHLYYLGEYDEREMEVSSWAPKKIISASELKD